MGDIVKMPLVATHRYEPAPVLPPAPPDGVRTKPILLDQGITRPGIGLTAEGIVRIFRQADAGWPMAQCDLFQDLIQGDGNLFSCWDGAIRAVAGADLAIMPGVGGDDVASEEAAAALAESLDLVGNLNFADMLEHQLEGAANGYAFSEIEWTFADGIYRPAWFHNVRHRRFRFTPERDEPRLLATDFDWEGIALEPGKWIGYRARGQQSARAGRMRPAAFFALFKRMGITDWVVAMRRFGIPHVIGKYSKEAGHTARKVLEEAVKQYGDAGSAVIEDTCAIEVGEHGENFGAREALNPGLVAVCDQEVARIFNGNVLTTSPGGQGATHALGTVQEGREFALTRAQARRLGYVFHAGLAWPFTMFNGFTGARAPRLAVQVSRDMDPLKRAQVAKIYGVDVGVELDADQLREEQGFRAPAPGRGTKPGGPKAQPKPAAPGGADGP